MHKPVVLLLLAIAGCAPVDRATIVVSEPAMAGNPFPAMTAGSGVRRAFERYTKGNGYSCHGSMRVPGRYICRGPKDLHLMFEPRVAGAGHVAGLSWVRSDDRSKEEFRKLVSDLEQALKGTGATVDVRFDQFKE
jgi:hypothetical protein